MTSEGKSARETLIAHGESCENCGIFEGCVDNFLLPLIERESRLSIAAALEMAANEADEQPVDCTNEHEVAIEIAANIRALTPESVAHARAEHDREVQMELLRKLLSEVSDPLFGKYGYRKDVANLIDAHIRALASTTEAQAVNPEDSGGRHERT